MIIHHHNPKGQMGLLNLHRIDMRKSLLFLLICLICFDGLKADVFRVNEKVYIDGEDFKYNTTDSQFYIHTGNNVWLMTNSINKDHMGVFTYECLIQKTMNGPSYKMQYLKSWKCPYCYNYWLIEKPCENIDCPSRYK